MNLNMKLNALVVATLTVAALSPSLAYCSDTAMKNRPAVQTHAARYRAVFHIAGGDSKKWNQALNNAQNVQKTLGKGNGDIEIVANGGGIGMLKFDSVVGDRVQEALKNGVKILACENTMKRMNLTKNDMLPNIGYTPSGVIEVMQKQQEGWSYVRN